MVFESADNQSHRVCLALASIALGHQTGSVRFRRFDYMGSLNTVDVTSRSIRHTLVQDHHR